MNRISIVVAQNGPATSMDCVGFVLLAIAVAFNVRIYERTSRLKPVDASKGSASRVRYPGLPPTQVILIVTLAWLMAFVVGRCLFGGHVLSASEVFATEDYSHLHFMDVKALLGMLAIGTVLNSVGCMWPILLLLTRRRQLSRADVLSMAGSAFCCLYILDQCFRPLAPYLFGTSGLS